MSIREVIPTHSAYLELKEERVGMQEGYHFLDEKRLILAAEILKDLDIYSKELDAFDADYAVAAQALRAAVGRHGLEGLSLYPPAPEPEGEITSTQRSVLGVQVQETQWPVHMADDPVAEGPQALDRSPEGDACRAAFSALPERCARLANLAANLERLRAEYARTARRARAMEDVLLPEIDATLSAIDTALEELEREEAVRVRRVVP
jgi:V/A-type H+/Na+-transporting ATPase subunit D